MLCDDCKQNEATYHSIRKINGIKTETHLCAQCRKKHEFDSLPLSGIGDMFGAFGDFFGSSVMGNSTCEYCGTTADDYLSTGFVGCEHCYDQFSRVILQQLQQMQQKIQHVGKLPGQQTAPTSEYARLKAELDKAIEVEDYERAGRINEELKKLKENK